MARQLTIIGIGEALLAEFPGQEASPSGLALEVSRAAARLGQRGLPISRLGQDLYANELLTQLGAIENFDATHLQSDPDLPTGRLIVRAIGAVRKSTLDQRAAFDNLQWDFDLVDVAKEADAVVFGMLAQRGGQCRSVIARFLDEATGALKVFDLTNREGDSFDRAHAMRSLDAAHIGVLDSAAWATLRLADKDAAPGDAAAKLIHDRDLAAVIWHNADEPLRLITDQGELVTHDQVGSGERTQCLLAIICAMLRGEDAASAIEAAERIAAASRKKPDEPLEL